MDTRACLFSPCFLFHQSQRQECNVQDGALLGYSTDELFGWQPSGHTQEHRKHVGSYQEEGMEGETRVSFNLWREEG